MRVDEATGGLLAVAVADDVGGPADFASDCGGLELEAARNRSRPLDRRRSRGKCSLEVVSINVSGWGTLKRLLPQLASDAEVILVQETKLATFLELAREKRWLAQQGWF